MLRAPADQPENDAARKASNHGADGLGLEQVNEPETERGGVEAVAGLDHKGAVQVEGNTQQGLEHGPAAEKKSTAATWIETQTADEAVIDSQQPAEQKKDQQQVVKQGFPQPQPAGVKGVGGAGAKLFFVYRFFEPLREQLHHAA